MLIKMRGSMKYVKVTLISLITFLLMSCAADTTKDETSTLKDNPPKAEIAEPPMAPGTALIEAEVTAVDEGKINIKILRRLASGRGVADFSLNDNLDLAVGKNTIKENKLEKGKIIRAVITGMQGMNESKTYWRILEIK